MAIFELFSKRQADAAMSGEPDVYQYANIPSRLRVQVEQIARDAMGLTGMSGDRLYSVDKDNVLWRQIEAIYLRERGLDAVANKRFAGERILSFMRRCSTEEWLDLLELIARGILGVGERSMSDFRREWRVSVDSSKAVDELNYRLRQAGVGYQIERGRLVRIDSQFVHAEVVKPALALLSEPNFEGPQQEFLSAHHHYRAGEYRQAVAMAANALESTLKAICDQKGWVYSRGARISDLIKIARENSLWPIYLDNSFDQLVATLHSGLPRIRDNDASHGQGSKPKQVPAYIAGYALHLAASKIVFIVQAAKAK